MVADTKPDRVVSLQSARKESESLLRLLVAFGETKLKSEQRKRLETARLARELLKERD